MKITLKLRYKDNYYSYNTNIMQFFNIDNQYFCLMESVKLDKFNQLVKDSPNKKIININTGLVAKAFDSGINKLDLLKVKTNFKSYLLELINKTESEIVDTCNEHEQINNISCFSDTTPSPQKNIVQKLGKYKITDNQLLEYAKELSKCNHSKDIISNFKKWVKFINEVVLFSGFIAEIKEVKSCNFYNIYDVIMKHDKGSYKIQIELTESMYYAISECLGINQFKEIIDINSESKEIYFEPPYEHIQNDIEISIPPPTKNIHFEPPYFNEISDIQIGLNTNYEKLFDKIKMPINSKKTKLSKLDKLNNRLDILKERLYNEQLRQHKILSNRGWGYGMRCSKIGFSTTKEDKIKDKILKLESEIKLIT